MEEFGCVNYKENKKIIDIFPTSAVSSLYVIFVRSPKGQLIWILSLFNCIKKTMSTKRALNMKNANTDLLRNSIKSFATRACVVAMANDLCVYGFDFECSFVFSFGFRVVGFFRMKFARWFRWHEHDVNAIILIHVKFLPLTILHSKKEKKNKREKINIGSILGHQKGLLIQTNDTMRAWPVSHYVTSWVVSS